MTDRTSDVSQRSAAIVTVVAYLGMVVAAIFSEFIVRESIVVPGDAATTAANIAASGALFRAGIGGYLIILICDVGMAWGLYVVLKQVSTSLSLLAAWFRLVYTAIFAMALLNLVNALRLASDTGYLAVVGGDQLQYQVMLSLNAFADGWAIGYVFFGLHLFFLGYLVFKSDYIPKILGILLLVAGTGYLIEYFGKFLFPDLNITIGIITGWGELLFMIWLLWKGGKVPEVNP